MMIWININIFLDQAKNAKPFPEEYRQDSFKVDDAKHKCGWFHI